ncbi:MAG: hypothetical protein HW380_816 [Magnetococcales bacterium]|nr:hypothetical protein [Magnetococcales bacterium]
MLADRLGVGHWRIWRAKLTMEENIDRIFDAIQEKLVLLRGHL